MCGFAGLWTANGTSADALRAAAERMIAPIAHRGPDDQGVWTEASAGVALGFRRLAILDLSEAGHQPMRSSSGRFTIAFNGEVFNFEALRRELGSAGAVFRGHSDTEVMLAAFERWGVAAAVRRFVGMFAFAVWDAHERSLTLGRDRLGIKPLFVSVAGGQVLFGSELKALAAHPDFDRRLDRSALTAYLRYLYVPAPQTIYAGAMKLLPGHLLVIRDPSAPLPAAEQYWSAEHAAERGIADPLALSDADAVDELERLLGEAIGLRMIADVPLGALLSGGVDSSTVVALMQRQSSRPVKTFTIAFDDAAYDEGAQAAQVAAHLGTDHTEMMVTGRDALEVVPKLSRMFDEPLADPSQIPTYLVSALARRSVTVALSGDGGDELFAGYNRYLHGERMIQRFGHIPASLRQVVASGMHAFPPAAWDRLYDGLARLSPGKERQRLPGEKLHKLGHLLGADSPEAMYRSLLSAWQQPEQLVSGAVAGPDRVTELLGRSAAMPMLDRMMLVDQLTYLADDLLAKVDRASMAVSLEARVPLLDHRVVEFAWRLPRRLRIRDGRGKWILRQVLYRHVPAALVDRPKMGFSVPVDAWLRGPLRDWGESLISAEALERDGTFAVAPVRAAWADLQAGRASSGLALWAVLLFRAWSDEWGVHS